MKEHFSAEEAFKLQEGRGADPEKSRKEGGGEHSSLCGA